MPHEHIWWLTLLVCAGAAISAAIWFIRRRPDARSWASVNEPHRINLLITRGVDRKVECSLEIFTQDGSAVYRGRVQEAENPSHLTLQLTSPPMRNNGLEGLPVQVHLNFHPGLDGPMEHYQFSSHTLGLNGQPGDLGRSALLDVAWPKNLISAQRRDFLRLEPVGEHSMICSLKEIPAGFSGDPAALPALLEGSVLDISTGGAQLLFPGAPELPEDRDYLLLLELPVTDLGLELPETQLNLVLSPTMKDVIRLGHEEADAHTILRGGFSGRYLLSREAGAWRRLEFSPEAFWDLADWTQAYQRYRLRKGL